MKRKQLHLSNQTKPENVIIFSEFEKNNKIKDNATINISDDQNYCSSISPRINSTRKNKKIRPLSPLSTRVCDTESHKNFNNLFTEYKSLSTRKFDFTQDCMSLNESGKNNKYKKSFRRNLSLDPSLVTISDSHYREVIQQIYLQRMQNSLNKNNTKLSIEDERSNSLNKVYDKNMIFLNRKAKKLQKIKDYLLSTEMQNCTFQTKLTKSTKKILKRSKSFNNDFYSKCIIWKNKRERNIQHQYMLLIKKSFEECRFYPKTNKNIHEKVIQEMKNNKGDYIYQKNLNWLKNVRENRKKGNLENLEQLRMEQEKFKIKNQQVINRINQRYKNKKETNEEILRRNLTSHNSLNNNVTSKYKNTKKNNNKADKGDTLLSEITKIKKMVKELNGTLKENKKNNLELKEESINNYSLTKRENFYQNKYSVSNTLNNVNMSQSQSFNLNTINKDNQYCEEMKEKYRLLMIKYKNEKGF